jgi:prepilin-type N-terminal cleavage/methylation domain-containing protein
MILDCFVIPIEDIGIPRNKERGPKMPARKTYPEHRNGLTLIEIMIAMTMIAVGVLGAMMYRYHSALDARKADVQVGAERVALLILEGWKGAAGLPGYDPSTIATSLNSPHIAISSPSGGVCTVQLTGGTPTCYYVTLLPPTEPTDLDGDGTTDTTGIRMLEVEVKFYGNGSPDTSLPAKTVRLADFVRI